MKKIAFLLFTFSFFIALAQPSQLPSPTRYTVSFEANRGESFSVFIDGDLKNSMPQTRVMVNDVSDQTHEVIVVLKRPAQKAAVLSLRPGEPNVIVSVNYDERLEQLLLYTPSHNRGESYEEEYLAFKQKAAAATSDGVQSGANAEASTEGSVKQKTITDEELLGMVQRMKTQPFDSDRLALGKVIVASSDLTAKQIARIAQTIDYSNSQVEFLKYAYHYCVDPANYYVTTDILTFSNDKRRVLDYIATQQR